MTYLTPLTSSGVGGLPDTGIPEPYDLYQKGFIELSTPQPVGTSLESKLQAAFLRNAEKEAGHADAMRTMISQFDPKSYPFLNLLSISAQHSVEIQVKSALAKKFTNVFDTLLK